MEAPSDLLTLSQAATITGLRPVTLRYRLARGLMHGQRLSTTLWTVTREEAERVKREGKLRPGPAPGAKAARGKDRAI